jgi:hypothetical protein
VPTGTVAHDNFRLLPTGLVQQKLKTLADLRRKLTTRKVELDTARTSAANAQARTSDEISRLHEQLGHSGASTEAIERQIEQSRDARRGQDARLDAAASRVGLVDQAIATIDAFVTALRTVPADAKRSPLTAAALHEYLHTGAEKGGFTHVLLVQSQNGSAVQLVDDKPLWWEDKFSVIASVTVAYMLLALPEGTMIAAGNADGTASIKGTIGRDFTIESS